MKPLALCLTLVGTAAPLAQALTVDAKALARFDQSYVVCEARFPEMKGRRDEAYLSIWRVQADTKAKADLAAARNTAAYRQEKSAVRKGAAAASAPASSPIEHQCQALWARAQGIQKPK